MHHTFLIADRDVVALSGPVDTDLRTLLGKIKGGQIQEALLNGAPLPNEILAGEPGRGEFFEAWLRLQRQSYDSEMRSALEQCLDSAETEVGIAAAEALLQLDPTVRCQA